MARYQRSSSRRSKRRTKKRNISEEAINEYLTKKAMKEAMRVAKKLNENFIWRKLIERDVARGVTTPYEFTVSAAKKRQKERMAEIEKVKKRREERAAEKAKREEELTMMMMLRRERARVEADEFEKKEEEFVLHQSKVRSKMRLRCGRTKPIDVLINYLDEFDVELDEPHMVFKGLTVKEIEELHDDIKLHLSFLNRAMSADNVEYWEALMVVCEWELGEARIKDAVDRTRVHVEQHFVDFFTEERGLHSFIETEVRNFLEVQSYKSLVALQADIESEIHSAKAMLVEYWEILLKRLQIYKAKACLKEIHAKMLRRHLHCLEESLLDENLKSGEEKIEEESNKGIGDARAFSSELITHEEAQDWEAGGGSFSPQLVCGEDTEDAIDPDEDRVMLEKKQWPFLEEGEVAFGSGAEVNLDSLVYWWHDKYRLRKPKYFNCVLTGYGWNKYNQTHYDNDNPPPKIVQGYKFNIFYTDLFDKTKASTYFIEKDGDSTETCIIRFHGGPPYEDIAFRIVNKELEHSHKTGYKCTFERGILRVHFKFKPYHYRR